MVRTLPHPSPFDGIDGKRIAGNTFVIALHALVFAVLMIPASMEEPPAHVDTTVVQQWIEPEKIKPTIPPPEKPPEVVIRREPQPTPPDRVVPDTPPVDTTPIMAEGSELAVETADVGPPAQTFEPSGPIAAELALDVHPSPPYPRQAIRQGMEGTVTLRVQVDATGKPVEVTIERSSGHRELDRAARDTVLNRWRFQPAQRDGQNVAAIGLVPIRFVLP